MPLRIPLYTARKPLYSTVQSRWRRVYLVDMPCRPSQNQKHVYKFKGFYLDCSESSKCLYPPVQSTVTFCGKTVPF